VTASHVLRDYINTDELWIGGKTAVRVNQRHFLSRDDDTYDLGFIPLTNEQRAIFHDITFITADNLDNDEDCGSSNTTQSVIRADDNEPEDDQTTLNARWSLYAAQSSAVDSYEERRVSKDLRLLLKFNRRILFGPDGPVETEPEPEGLSGAGVWRLNADSETDVLSAVVDSHSDIGNLIYATRLKLLMESLDAYAVGKLS
jgi:hypothetical protein